MSADLRSPPGRSFQTAQPVVIKNFQAQDDFIHSGLLQEQGIVSLVNVPVLIEGAAWGVLEVDSTRQRDFSQDTIEFLTAAAALPIATVAFYGPNLSQATKVTVGIVPSENAEVKVLRDWKVDRGDIRANPGIAHEILEFYRAASSGIGRDDRLHNRLPSPRRNRLRRRMVSACEFWHGRDRFTGQTVN